MYHESAAGRGCDTQEVDLFTGYARQCSGLVLYLSSIVIPSGYRFLYYPFKAFPVRMSRSYRLSVAVSVNKVYVP